MSASRENSRLSIEWSERARADLRSIDRSTALDLLHCVDRYLRTREGDVKHLKPPLIGLRLRCGDYRIFFRQIEDDVILAKAVRHRSVAYRG